MQMEIKLASESHVPRFRAGVGTWRSGYMIPIRLPWRHRARPSATLHEIQVCPERQTCVEDSTRPTRVRQLDVSLRSVLICFLGLLLGVLVVFGGPAHGKVAFHVRKKMPVMPIAKRCFVRLRGYPIGVFDQTVNDQLQGFSVRVQPTSRRVSHGLCIVAPRINQSQGETVSRANECLIPQTVNSVNWRDLHVLFRRQMKGDKWPKARDYMGRAFPVVEHIQFKNGFCSLWYWLCFDLNHNPRSFRIYERLGIQGRSRCCISRGLGLNDEQAIAFECQRCSSGGNEDKYASQDERNTVNPVPVYRHGGRFSDSYGLFCICFLFGICFLLTCIGCDRLLSGLGRTGWCFIALGIIADFLAGCSLIVGCLPWSWWTCLHDGQKHSQRQYFHNRQIVPRKYLTEAR